jgi:hypothetical protein
MGQLYTYIFIGNNSETRVAHVLVLCGHGSMFVAQLNKLN